MDSVHCLYVLLRVAGRYEEETYLIISTINIELVPVNTPIYMITFVVGGAILIGGAYLIIYLLTKAAMKKAAAAGVGESEVAE